MTKQWIGSAMAVLATFATVGTASASTITFATPAGTTIPSGAVNAQATFVTGNGTLSITLTDLQASPANVGQVLGGLFFTLSSGQTSDTGTTSSAQLLTISGGVGSTGSTGSTGWLECDNINSGFQLTSGACGGNYGPDLLIIGPGPYTNANNSINGNGPHNPFLNGTATFTMGIAGLTAGDTVSSAAFSFGTDGGYLVHGCVDGRCDNNTTQAAVPEPASLLLLGTGLGLVGGMVRRRSKKAAK